MPRRRRGFLDHACYHITHRCHRREFLLKFARNRDIYLDLLRETASRFKIDVLDYAVTSNHVHLLIWTRRGTEVAAAMQYLQGRFGQIFNRSKGREGAYWSDRYHSTLIESGRHLGQCIFYIGMNMVRAKAVEHPSEWKHSGYRELSGEKKRYRIINMGRLMKCLMMDRDVEGFRKWYVRNMDEKVKTAYNFREPMWTEAFAVGDEEWLRGIHRRFKFKRKRILYNPGAVPDNVSKRVREKNSAYYIEG
jgi:putative transposase